MLAGVDFQCRWVVEGQGHGHGQGHLRRDNFYICAYNVLNEVGIFFGFSSVGIQNISFESVSSAIAQLVC